MLGCIQRRTMKPVRGWKARPERRGRGLSACLGWRPGGWEEARRLRGGPTAPCNPRRSLPTELLCSRRVEYHLISGHYNYRPFLLPLVTKAEEGKATLEIIKPPTSETCLVSGFCLAGDLTTVLKTELEQLLAVETLTNQGLQLYHELSL